MTKVEAFKHNNPNVAIDEENGKIIVSNCWNDNSFKFVFNDDSELTSLDNVILHKELFALYHSDKQQYEFIFLPLNERYEREFSYNYCGNEFHLHYGEPSKAFEVLARHLIDNDSQEISDRTYGLIRYEMYYSSLNSESHQQLFPTNFFIEGDFDKLSFEEHVKFFYHVNFMLSYYDRFSPCILIYTNEEKKGDDVKVPCKSKSGSFPEIIHSKTLDSSLLELMDAAKNASSSRLQFIFYFQVLEYCSYYYIENNLRRNVANIIKTPDILDSEKYTHKIIEVFSDYFKSNNDGKRMDRLLLDMCSYEDIKDELKTNGEYFIKDICFDGGFTVPGIFKDIQDIDNPPKDVVSTIRRNIDSIRNVLVHARESRENVIIKPTNNNVRLLKPYLYLLRRIAETIVIKYE